MPTLQSIPIGRPEPSAEEPQGMCLDKGYDFDELREVLAEFGFTAHIRARGDEAAALKRHGGPGRGGGWWSGRTTATGRS